MGIITRIVFIVLIFFAGWWLLSRMNAVPSLGDLFRQKPVRIADSPLLISEIKSLAQLITVSAYDEIVVDSTILPIPGKSLPAIIGPVLLPVNEVFGRQLVVIGKVVSHAGIDMARLDTSNIHIMGDSIHLSLPRARVLDTIVNPSGIDVFIEKGNWSNDAIASLKTKIKATAAQNMERRGLLLQSERKAKEVMTDFFKAAGYEKVGIDFNGRP